MGHTLVHHIPFPPLVPLDEPSLCYVFEGDGVCEVFERGSSVQDCGYFTPHGYSDQWASTAAASYQDQSSCPALGATGEPSLSKVAVLYLCPVLHLLDTIVIFL